MTLSFDPDALELPFHHFIGGERVDAAGALEIRRPHSGIGKDLGQEAYLANRKSKSVLIDH